ncbi:hypothetical protein KCP75_06590 [Salmonella enterica subsp. enterica]|nr:hypothetical protein KCP75_06590 [Salmonella enterica subsp. enterica]
MARQRAVHSLFSTPVKAAEGSSMKKSYKKSAGARAGTALAVEIESVLKRACRVDIKSHSSDRGGTPGLIRIDGHLISVRKSPAEQFAAFWPIKPEGELCTRNDPEGGEAVLIAYRRAARVGLR